MRSQLTVAVVAAAAVVAVQAAEPAVKFSPPAESAIPSGELGDLVRRGQAIFTDTKKNAGDYVGNDLKCSNCHLDAGRAANAAPMWGAYVAYPRYREKTKRVDTFAQRLQDCFRYSMNGKAPPLEGDVIEALVAYSFWLATGAPVNTPLQGAGLMNVAEPVEPPDYARGHEVYAAKCASCHGQEGQGLQSGGVQMFPPLWGARSFNWGAGMQRLDKAAAFIKANMPLGQGGTLSDREAWDVAYFMAAHERPQDPRYAGSIAETRKRFHDSKKSVYGTMVDGRLLGAGAR
jgi:thiosulfate dehydrogenase